MAMLRDSAGLITSTGDAASLEHFEQALASLFRSDGNALPVIERALEHDPAFAAGHCLRAGAIVLSGGDTHAAALAASVAAIESNSGANERARRHAAAAAPAPTGRRDQIHLRRERARTQACRCRAPLARRQHSARIPTLRRAAPRLSSRPAGALWYAQARFSPPPAAAA